MVAEADEALMEAFFAEGTLTQEQLERGAARRDDGRQDLPARLHVGRSRHRHPAAARRHRAATCRRPPSATFAALGQGWLARTRSSPADSAPYAAFVWKTIADPFAGRITMLRVVAGTLKSDATVHNVTRDAPERLGHLLALQGKTQTHVPELRAGDLGRRRQAEGHAHQRRARREDDEGRGRADQVSRAGARPTPSSRRAAATRTRSASAMQRLQEEDPSISYARDPQTHELLLAGQGQLHIEVTVAKLKRRFGVEVNLKPPRIPYRETITAATEAHGRHKKQTGGHGQFGDCKIRVEPLPRGSDFQFEDDIFGGAIPRQYVPGRRKGDPGRAHARLPRRLPDGGLQGDGLRRLVPRRWTRTSCRSRWRGRSRSRTR